MSQGKCWDLGMARFLVAALLLTGSAAPATAKFLGKKKKEKEEVIVPFVPKGGWEAYIHDDEGRDRALLQPLEQNEDADWMFIRYTEHSGKRNRIAILRVENQAIQSVDDEDEDERVEIPLANIEDLFATSLFETKRFDVIERKRIQASIAEQDFGTTDRVNKKTAVEVGNLLGADYLLIITVNEWTPEKRRIGAAGLGQSLAEVALSFRVIDAASGEMTFSTTQRATAGSWNFVIGGNKAPINYSLTSCLNKGAYALANSLKPRAWQGMVADIKGSKIFINAGSNRGIETGTKLTALSKGAEILDPETNQSLGHDSEVIGTLTVTSVTEKLSVAAIVQGCKGLKKGDLVELSAEK